jgi:cell division protein FtsB
MSGSASKTELLELESERETSQWRHTMDQLEIARLQCDNDVLARRNAQLVAEVEIMRESESREHARANERERDSLKDMVAKL